MREISGDLWEFHRQGHWIAIPTNGVVRQDGANIMGKGIALAAKRLFVSLPYQIGTTIQLYGNHVHEFPEFRVFSFPTKHHWRLTANLELIEQSATELRTLVDASSDEREVFLPLVGCGNGRLQWSDVRPILVFCLDDRFTVVHWSFERLRSSS